MTTAIVYQRRDGQTCICHPAYNARLCGDPPVPFFVMQKEAGLLGAPFGEAVAKLKPTWAETEAAFMARVQARSVPPDAANVRIVDASNIPADRTFRNALKTDLTHDMERCRAIHRDRMRVARAPKLAALDVEYQRADEAGDTDAKRAIALRKQALRDVTRAPEIDAAKTPGALKAVWPAELA